MTDLVKVIYKWNEMISWLKWDDGKDGKDWAEFRFVTQSEYDALTEEEKMNGITYAIYWTTQWDEVVEAWKRFINREPLSWEYNKKEDATVAIPAWAKFLYLMVYYNYNTNSEWWTTWLYPIKAMQSWVKALISHEKPTLYSITATLNWWDIVFKRYQNYTYYSFYFF